MTDKKTEGQGPAEWIDRKKAIERHIADINRKLDSMPNHRPLTMVAGDAKTRLASFIYLNGGSEGQIRRNKQGVLRRLKEDAEETAKAAKRAKE